jgi:mevalonate kinase
VNLPAHGRGAGKVILLGEHAVVYGRPALAASLPLGLVAEVGAGSGAARLESDHAQLDTDPRLAALVAEALAILDLPAREVVIRVRSELEPGVGLGSSAALCVAVLRALASAGSRILSREEEFRFGRRLEAIFHGHPSGIDPAAAALGGGCFRFLRGDPPTIAPLRLARALPLVVAMSTRPRSTGAAVTGLRARWEADPTRYERVFDDVASVVEEGIYAAERGDLEGLGRAFDRNQALLETLGVSVPEVEELAERARRAGALGAKLTGGGAGGAVVAVAAEPDAVARVLAASGVRTIVARVGADAAEGRAA